MYPVMRRTIAPPRRGFTLIELLIVVAIVGILASIAIPTFLRYRLKTRASEAKLVLGGIKTSQEAFRTEQDQYANIVSPQPALVPGTVRTSWGAMDCPGTCSKNNVADCDRFACIGFAPAGTVFYRYAAPARTGAAGVTAEFGAGAQGDLDGDGEFGSFAFRSAAAVGVTTGVVADGISTCATDIAAGEVRDCAPATY